MKKTATIFRAVFIALVSVVAVVFYLTQTPTSITPALAESCPTPAQVTGVKIDFPYCVGSQCNFTQANCSWSTVAGATKYQVAVTEVETNTLVTNQQLAASVTNLVFNINQNKTYSCNVSAINACGTTGASGAYSLFCKVDALVSSPSPTASTPQTACGTTCTSTAGCQTGLTCVVGSSGQGYCALPALTASCQSNPSVSACCNAPIPTTAPLPKPGGINTTIAVGSISLVLLIAGVFLFLL